MVALGRTLLHACFAEGNQLDNTPGRAETANGVPFTRLEKGNNLADPSLPPGASSFSRKVRATRWPVGPLARPAQLARPGAQGAGPFGVTSAQRGMAARESVRRRSVALTSDPAMRERLGNEVYLTAIGLLGWIFRL